MAYKDLIKACLMEDTHHFLLVIPQFYDGGGYRVSPYEEVVQLFKTIFESNRLNLPLKTVTALGY